MKLPQRVLFINPITAPALATVRVSMGVASLSAMLKREGHKTALLCPWEFNPLEIQLKINEFNQHIIAISSVSSQFELTKKIIQFLKNKFKLPIILGGIHATVAPEECIIVPGILGICIGEGDLALLEFVNKFSLEKDYTGSRCEIEAMFNKGNILEE